MSASADMRPVLVERYEGIDSRDVPRLIHEWSIEGVERTFTVDVPEIPTGQYLTNRTRFQVYVRINPDGNGAFNQALQHLAVRGALDVYAEFIVFRRDHDGTRLLNMRLVDVSIAESAVITYVSAYCPSLW